MSFTDKLSDAMSFLSRPKEYLDSRTHYPDSPRKSPWRFIKDQIWYIFHRDGIHMSRYFRYGLDRQEITTAKLAEYAFECQKCADKKIASNKLSSVDPSCDYIVLLRDKLCFGTWLKQFGFPTPVNDYMVRGGKITDMSTMREISIGEMPNLKFDHFFKPATGGRGIGIFHLRSTKTGLTLNGKPVGVDELAAILAEGFFVGQRRVEQHLDLTKINPGSINTLRLLTIQTEDGVKPMLAAMRFGTDGSVVDNASSGGLCVGVDMQTGRIKGPGNFKKQNLLPYIHPPE